MLYGGKNEEIYKKWEPINAVVDLNEITVKNAEYNHNVKATRVDEAARHAMMQSVWRDSAKKIMIDPHTANAVVGALQFREKLVPVVAYETAKPFKFPEVMQRVLGEQPLVPKRFAHIFKEAADKSVPHISTYKDLAEYLDGIGVKRK